ncbi:MAG: hypothetical protein QXY18_01040 [Nitrososphaerota archaeon]
MEIITKRIKVLPKRKIFHIIPIGDLHFGSLAFNENLWKSFLKRVNDLENPLFIVVGDIIDDDRPSTRDRRTTLFIDRNEAYQQEDIQHLHFLVKLALKKLSFLNPTNCLGMLDGDHYRVYSNGKTSTEVLCTALKVPYLGRGQAIIRLLFQFSNTTRLFTIHARHGRGFHSTEGGKINANRKFVNMWEGVDLFVKGHSHSSWEDDVVRNVVTREGFIYEKCIGTLNSGSFRKTFIMRDEIETQKRELLKEVEKKEIVKKLLPFIGIKENTVDYPEIKEYPPTNKKLMCFKISWKKTRKIKGYPDYEGIYDIVKLQL